VPLVEATDLYLIQGGEMVMMRRFLPHLNHELVMNNKDKVYYYSGDVAGTTMFVTDALTGFRLIKYQTHKRRLINN